MDDTQDVRATPERTGPPDGAAPVGAQPSGPGIGTPPLLRRRWVRIVLAVGVLWAVAVVVPTLMARSRLQAAESALDGARSDIGDLDLDAAAATLAAAQPDTASARRLMNQPQVVLASWVPLLGNDLAVARAVAAAGDEAVDAAISVVDTLRALPGGVAAFAPRDGRIPLDVLEAVAPPLDLAASRLEEARELVADTPAIVFTSEVRDGRERFLELADPTSQDLRGIADLVAALPRFLGGFGERRYFLAAANPAEQRGTGGYLGSYAIATFEDGALSIGEFRDLLDLPELPASEVAPPTPAFADRYLAFGGAGRWKNLNMTPDFPSAALAIEQLWELTQGEVLDGVIVVDPFAFEALLAVTGPIEIEGVGSIEPDNVVRFLTNEAYAALGTGEERKTFLGEVGAVALDGFLRSADVDALKGAVPLLADLVGERHLLLHATDPVVQAAFQRVRIAGVLRDPPGDFLMVAANSAANAKVDFYTEREVVYDVTLLPDGAASGEVTVTFVNNAPDSGFPSHVLGPNVPGLGVGDNRLVVGIYCATSCELGAASGGIAGRATAEEELGHPVAGFWVEVGGQGGTAEVQASWIVADAWEDVDGELVYRFMWQDQTTIPTTSLRVVVALPEGAKVREASDGVEILGGQAVFEREAHGDAQFTLTLGRS